MDSMRIPALLLRLLACFMTVTIIAVSAFHVPHQGRSLGSVVFNQSLYGMYRTGYHFQPPKNWMNDPNGPMFYKGYYHLFYQYNPDAAVWGNITWGHVVSTDLLHWRQLPTAIKPTHWYDIKGCWSGSATLVPGRGPIILYTGWDENSRQVQNLALPADPQDPLLQRWIKSPQNPVVQPDRDLNASSFRDPTTAWLGRDGRWRILVGNKRRRRGRALLYRSRDLVHWRRAKHELHTSARTGMWECPDFYPVAASGTKFGLDTSAAPGHGGRHVLKASLDDFKYEYYTVGTYFPEHDRYVPDNSSADDENGLRYDYGKFYASKTFFDGLRRRRILWGWIDETDTKNDDMAKGWAGLQSIPRKLWLDGVTGAQLMQWPIEEVESLRRQKTSLTNVLLPSGKVQEVAIANASAAQVDVEVSFDLPALKAEQIRETESEKKFSNLSAQELCSHSPSSSTVVMGPLGLLLLASKDLRERTAVYFQIVRLQDGLRLLMCSDQSMSSTRPEVDKPIYGSFVSTPLQIHKPQTLHLRVLVDHSIVESFGEGGRTCMTARVYPAMAVGPAARLFVFNNATSAVTLAHLSAWHMDSTPLSS